MSNASPSITVITVCYNAASTLEQTLQSVLAQDYPDVEYIVIDGHSQDQSKSILNRYKSKIDTLICEPDKGIYHAMNKGIVRAQGEVIGFLNADDLFAHDKVLSTVASTFAEHKVDSVFSDLIYFKDTPADIKRYWRASPFRPGLFAKGWNPPHPTFYVRKSIYQQYGGFDLSIDIANDIELMMRFLEKFRISSYYVPEVWVNMRLGGLSNQDWRTILKQNRAILRASQLMGLPIPLVPFCIGKVSDRVKQLVKA